MSPQTHDSLQRLRARLDSTSASLDHSPSLAAASALDTAAVLTPLVERPDGLTVILTVRAAHMRRHPGQISFPGGRIEEGDPSLAATALREAHEEIGLKPDDVQLLGRYDRVETGTGYSITPFVGLTSPDFEPRADPDEVAETFEVPFAFLMDPANHRSSIRRWRGVTYQSWEMPYAGRRIWGATAGLLKRLHDRLYAQGAVL